MPLDLDALVSTPDIRAVPTIQARIVCGLRYIHTTRVRQCYCADELAVHLGGAGAVRRLHVFLDEAGCAWPDPIALNPPCQPSMSYDEMLLVDCCCAAARGERTTFDALLSDMMGEGARRSLWLAAGRLMRMLGLASQRGGDG